MKKIENNIRRQVTVDVVENIDLGPTHPGHFRLVLRSEHLSANSKPGQFIHVLPPGNEEMLRRPFSVMTVDPDNGTCTILYRVIGEGTTLLSKAGKGDKLNVIGPLGNGFPVIGDRTAIIIGGGVGIPPLVYLAEALIETGLSVNPEDDKAIHAVLGARNPETLVCVNDFNNLGVVPSISLETAPVTFAEYPAFEYRNIVRGFVTDILKVNLNAPPPDAVVYACGPIPMLGAVAEWSGLKNLECYVSLENKLGCGIGACLGCSVPVREHDSTVHYERVCMEGPTFDATRVAFDLM